MVVYEKRPDGTIAISSRMCKQILLCNGFSSGERFEAIPADGIINVYFGNPAGSGKNIKLVKIEIITTSQFYLDMYMNNTVDTLGTASIIMNLNIENENTSVVKVEHSGDIRLVI